MKKNVLWLMSIFLILFFSIDSIKLSYDNESENFQPNSSNSADFIFNDIIIEYSNYSEILELSCILSSPSNITPSDVIVSLNNIEYKLSAVYFEERTLDGDLLENSVKKGIKYSYFLSSIKSGLYQIQFSAKYNDEIVKNNKIYEITIPSTPDEFVIKANHQKLYHNNIYFYAEISQKKIEEITQVSIEIDENIFSMNYDLNSNKWYYIHDFGMNNSEIHEYSMISLTENNVIRSNKNYVNCSYFSKNSTLQIYKSLWYNSDNNFKTYRFYLLFTNWEDKAPESLLIEKNGINQTLELNIFKFYDENDWRNGKVIGPVYVSFNASINHTLIFHAYNGSNWISNIVFNETYIFLPLKTTFSMDILNQTIFENNSARYWNLRLNISSTISELKIKYVHVSFENPALNSYIYSSIDIELKEEGIQDLISGKIYSNSNILLNDLESQWWGDLNFTIFIIYLDPSNQTNYWQSDFFIIENNLDGGKENYSFTKDNWVVLELTQESEYYGVFKQKQSYSGYFLYKCLDYGRNLGSDFIDYKKYIWDSYNNEWIDIRAIEYQIYDLFSEIPEYSKLCHWYNPFNRNGVKRRYIDPDQPSSLWEDRFFLPYNYVETLYNYAIEKTVSNYFSYKNQEIHTSWEIGDNSLDYSVKYKDGFIIEDIFEYRQGKLLVERTKIRLCNRGVGELPNSPCSLLFTPFPSIIISISIVLSFIGISIIIKKKREVKIQNM